MCDCVKKIDVKPKQADELQIVECGYVFKERNGIYYFAETYECIPTYASDVEFVHKLLQS